MKAVTASSKKNTLLAKSIGNLTLLIILGIFIFIIVFSWLKMNRPLHTLPSEEFLATPSKTDDFLSPSNLFYFSIRTMFRMIVGMAWSFLFSFVFGILAVKYKTARRVILPLVNFLESVPLLGFLTFTTAWLLGLFPGNVMGAEAVAIFAIFTGQAWNIMLTLYQIMEVIPSDLVNVTDQFKYNAWEKFWRLEFVYSIPGLLWNVIISQTAAWFALVASEQASVAFPKETNLYLPGIGSYIQVALNRADFKSCLWATMDMNSDYGDGANPVILKSEFILSLCEQLIGGASLGAKQKSIIDRCTAGVYRYYQQGNYMGTPPTLQDFREELLKQDEPEAQEIALAIELFTDGSLNTFAKHTNVDTHSRLICYDILDLGKQLQPIGMLVVLDSILNRITQNRAKGRNTFIFIDEIYLLFQHEYSANFLFTLWKRVRKYGAYCTGITQNVDDLLQSHTARTMLANSEFIIMLNQASTDRIELAKLLNISDLQMSYITNVGAGQGLLKVGSSLVPFVNKFPRNTELYKLMTTKFGEV